MIARPLILPLLFVMAIAPVVLGLKGSWGQPVNAQEFGEGRGVSNDDLAKQEPESQPFAASALRRPVAMELSDGGRTLVVANQATGSLSLIDLARCEVTDEFVVTDRIDDMAIADNDCLLLVNTDRHELLAARFNGQKIEVVSRIALPKYPVSICRCGLVDGQETFAIASLWSRRVSLVQLTSAVEEPQLWGLDALSKIDLPFAPRAQLFLEKSRRLVVADAFGGSLAVVDVDKAKIESVQRIEGHNIRGMALTPDGGKIGLTHQVLYANEPARLHAVRSAHLLINVVREISLEDLLANRAGAHPLAVSELGVYGDGAADPADLVYLPDGSAVIALSGTNEIAVGKPYGRKSFDRIYGQRRPTSLCLDMTRNQVYVANTFADSISVLDLESTSLETIPLGSRRELTASERGEQLFYSAGLSRDGWLSCHSCHTDGHTNGLKSDTRGDGAFGNPKQIPSLLGVGLTDTWAWDGHVKELNDQVAESIVSTMHGKPLQGEALMQLTAYLRSLPPAPSFVDARDMRADADVVARLQRGKQLFVAQRCNACHVGPLTYTTGGAFEVGLRDELGGDKFNPPSLRGVSQRSRFFHDGRAANLTEVLDEFGHQNSGELSDEQIEELVAFLRSL